MRALNLNRVGQSIVRFATTAIVAMLAAQSVLAAQTCPTAGDIPAKIKAARYVLTNPPKPLANAGGESGGGLSSGSVITDLVQFIVARAKQEAEVWLARSVISSLCTKSGVSGYFSSTCELYNSKLLNIAAGGTQSDINLLVQSIRTDVTYTPACALYEKLSVSLQSGTIPNVPSEKQADYKEGIAALGYYYTAVATKATTAVPNSESLVSLKALAAGGFQLVFNDIVVAKPSDADILTAWKAVSAAQQGNYSFAFATMESLLGLDNSGVSSELSQALTTAIALATATDAAGVQNVLDGVVSPIGASVVKQAKSQDAKGTPIVLSVTALPGIQVGRDTLGSVGEGVKTTSYGFFLPIGFQVSRAMAGGALGLLVSPLDAGGLVSYANSASVSGGKVQSSPQITWSSVEAPGVYLTYSIHDSPFVAGIGYQRSPHLRSVELTNQTTSVVPANRVMIYFAVDVTLFLHSTR